MNYYVHADNGNNNNNGKSPNTAFADLGYAMKRLHPGDTLFVRSGIYRGFPYLTSKNYRNGTSDKPILVRRYKNENPIISKRGESRLVDIQMWEFQGLTFQSAGTIKLGGSEAGKCQSFVSDITFRNNRFQHSSSAAIKIQCAQNIKIVHNVFDNLRSRIAGRDVHAITSEISTDRVTISGNKFRDIGADGIQLAGNVGKTWITANTFEVRRPYKYRGEDGKVDSRNPQRFGNVGENGLDIKSGPGPILVKKNTFYGFRPSVPEQDVSGSNGVAIVIHKNSYNINVRQNYFNDNVDHLRIVRGAGAKSDHPWRNVWVSNNVFNETAYSGNRKPTSLVLDGVRKVRIHNNTFYNTQGSGKRILSLRNIAEVELLNNLFHNGQLEAQESYIFKVVADYNSRSSIAGKVLSSLAGPHDLILETQEIEKNNWTPLPDSSLIDAGIRIKGLNDDFYGKTIKGAGPDIGAVEFSQ
ncbi:right-handed parallel beta-helix repeat-containing protein [Pseudohalioglobus lutimaris]|uniref:right-handed parallel beta-helix repeat-containing protein n=1 Tax=Pseudohalioglobus lutimaris TaxID=1737061 RepID=UPI0013FD274E|nr:right-handed parallel beta-helix repeat-containing protein [Pseudohalioglobus lutimaris]